MAHRRRRWLRWRSLLVVPALAVLLLGVSLAGAAVAPGNVSFEANWADWLRANHAGWLAQHVEELYYSANAPAKGGRPKGLNKVPVTVDAVPTSGQTSTPDSRQGVAANTAVTRPTTTTTTVPPGLSPPTPVPLVVYRASRERGCGSPPALWLTVCRRCTWPNSGPTTSTPARSRRRYGLTLSCCASNWCRLDRAGRDLVSPAVCSPDRTSIPGGRV